VDNLRVTPPERYGEKFAKRIFSTARAGEAVSFVTFLCRGKEK